MMDNAPHNLTRWYAVFFGITALLLALATAAAAATERAAPAHTSGATLVGLDAPPAIEEPPDAPDAAPEPAPAAEDAAAELPAERESLAAAAPASEPERAQTGGRARWDPRSEGDCLVTTHRATTARSVRRREPIDTEGPFFADGYPVHIFLDIMNRTGRSQRVYVQWTHEASGHVLRDSVSASQSWGWRTSVEQALPLSMLGTWSVEILDRERCLVEGLSFELLSPSW